MKKHALVLAVFLALAIEANSFGNEIKWQEKAGGELGIKAVLINPDDERVIYLGSEKGIFLSQDRGESWKLSFLTRGQDREVNFLSYDNRNKNRVYAACGNGLFYSDNQGQHWQRIFKGKNSLENECSVVTVLDRQIYLGTKNGLFISRDHGRSWHKASGRLKNDAILAIVQDINKPAQVYVVSVSGVFKSIDQGQAWERIFVAETAENNGNEEEINVDQDEDAHTSNLRYAALDIAHNQLYLATSRGVYKSVDQGSSWELLPSYGLLEQDVKALFFSAQAVLYALTKRGIFGYDGQRWHEYSQGITSLGCNFLTADKQGNFYLATDKGLFKGMVNPAQDKIITAYYRNEPEIEMVQQAAIKYAEVSPEKIIQWRKQAAKKAFLPKLSARINRDTSDLWHWESGSTTKINDDILIRGTDAIGWDVTLTWDLSEIIWNSDQTSIDVRSRLMVQLRDDIIDEVTKTYFERLRVKMELDNLTIEDRKKRYDKELRLEELTASLDGLTGGYFSAQLKSN